MRGAVTTGDATNDRRLAEHHAWAAVRTAYQRLADDALTGRRRSCRLARLGGLKAAWWRALQERDAADGIKEAATA